MALMKSAEVPKDAVILSEDEASVYAWEMVYNWQSFSDTWALHYGPIALGGISSLSGLLINRHYRWRFRLGSYGYLASAIPLALMPGMLTAGFHRFSVSTNMLLMKNDACPVCFEVKAAVIQLGFGIFYPMVLGPTSALMLANRYGTFRVPHLSEGPKVLFNFLRQHTKKFNSTLTGLVIAHLVTSSIVTYFEMKNNISLRVKMAKIEEEMNLKQNHRS